MRHPAHAQGIVPDSSCVWQGPSRPQKLSRGLGSPAFRWLLELDGVRTAEFALQDH